MKKDRMKYPKKYMMWAIYNSTSSMVPSLIFRSQWAAKSYMFERKESSYKTWDKAYVKRVMFIQQSKTHFDIYKHEYKRI